MLRSAGFQDVSSSRGAWAGGAAEAMAAKPRLRAQARRPALKAPHPTILLTIVVSYLFALAARLHRI